MCAHTRISESISEAGLDETMDKAVRAKGNDTHTLTVEVQLGLRFSVSSCKVTISVFLAL